MSATTISRQVGRTLNRAYYALPNAVGSRYGGIPGRITSHINAHAVGRHGGKVSLTQLATRARTGVAPDGSSAINRQGKIIIPRQSSAFHSNDLLVDADNFLRNSLLQSAILANPGETRLAVTGNVGINLGRGFGRVGTSTRQNVQGPLQLFDNLTSATGVFHLNPLTGVWETFTIFPR